MLYRTELESSGLMHSPVTFGQQLTARRKRLGVSQSAAAREAGVGRMTWRAWENDESLPQEYNYVRIERVMEWESGSVERAITQEGEPVIAAQHIEFDRRRVLLDDTEHEMWDIGTEGKLPEERIWWRIFRRRERNAEEEAARRGRNSDSA